MRRRFRKKKKYFNKYFMKIKKHEETFSERVKEGFKPLYDSPWWFHFFAKNYKWHDRKDHINNLEIFPT